MVIGASCLDVFAGSVNASVFESSHTRVKNVSTSFGGDALNEAVILSHFGNDVRLITVLGKDEAGESICSYIWKNGIAFDDGLMKDNIDTSVAVILSDENDERHFLSTSDSSLRRLGLSDIRLEEARIVSLASIFVSSLLKNEELSMLFRQVKKQNSILVADMTKPKNSETLNEYRECLSYLDYFFPNEEEALMLTGCSDVFDAAEKLFEAGVKNTVIKCADKGAYIRNDRYQQYVETEKVSVVDSTGAGDAFAAAFINELLKGKDILECTRKANEYGGKAVRYTGTLEWLNHD